MLIASMILPVWFLDGLLTVFLILVSIWIYNNVSSFCGVRDVGLFLFFGRLLGTRLHLLKCWQDSGPRPLDSSPAVQDFIASMVQRLSHVILKWISFKYMKNTKITMLRKTQNPSKDKDKEPKGKRPTQGPGEHHNDQSLLPRGAKIGPGGPGDR